MPDLRSASPVERSRRDMRAGVAVQHPSPSRAARDAMRSTAAARGSSATREVRLVRTIVSCAVLLALFSALSGYLLHGRGHSAGVRPADPATRSAPVAQAAAPTATPTRASGRPTPSATPPATKKQQKQQKPTAKSTAPTGPATVRVKGNGTFTPVLVPQRSTATTGRVVTYRLEVESGMPVDTQALARTVGATLLDRRGWQGVDRVRFVQVTPAQLAEGAKAQLTISVASPAQVDKLCAPLPTHGDTSCATGQHVVLNYKLWVHGVVYFKGKLAEYREYMVNHEVGHALGHGHQMCSGRGAYAPVMQQQTLGLQGCQPWPWPQRPTGHGAA